MENKCVYFDGQSAQEHVCTLHVADDCLYIYLTEHNNQQLIINKANIVNYQLNFNHLTVKIGTYPHQVVECYGTDANELYQALAQNSVLKTSQGFFNKNMLLVALVASVVFVGLGMFAFFVALPWAAEKSATLIPLDAEKQLGESIAASITQSATVNDSATLYANKYVAQLNTHTNYAIHVTVIESDEINAFALPGGQLFVYTGIIKQMKTPEEFAALLGHEISHVSHQHSLKSICRTLSSSLFIAAVFGDVSGISAGIVQQANEFKQLTYSRELETEADEKGLEMMVQNKINPNGMIDLLTMLDKEATATPAVLAYFSTHPETIIRIKNIKAKPIAKQKFAIAPALKLWFDKLQTASK